MFYWAYNLSHISRGDPHELIMDIFKHGAEVEVIEPEELRCKVLEHLLQAAEKYTSRKVKK